MKYVINYYRKTAPGTFYSSETTVTAENEEEAIKALYKYLKLSFDSQNTWNYIIKEKLP